jgi:UDP-3-O-[3-hydroxymyristoyl] glucosamine N-acyltransferase
LGEIFNKGFMADNRFFTNKGPFSIQKIAEEINCKIIAPNGVDEKQAKLLMVREINTLENAASDELTFYSNTKYLDSYRNTKCLVCITSEKYIEKAPKHLWILVSDNPYKSYAEVTNLFYPTKEEISESYIAPGAIVSDKAFIGKKCHIGPNAVIEEGVELGDNSVVDAGAILKKGVKIGKGARIGANVVIGYSIIGEYVLILPGACIGQDGFGFATDKGKHYKVAQLGRVIIGNDVEIGAGTTIDRGAIGDTIIEDLCRIDNLVQIGHNVVIGKGSIIVAQVGIAGSTKIGDYCVLGGQVGVAGHLEIGSFSQIAAQSGIAKSLEPKSIVGGTPAQPLRDWHKQQIILRKLQEKQ